MKTAEEMQAEGIHREVKMIALAHMGEMASELGLILLRDDEIPLAEILAGTVAALRVRCEELNAENLDAFRAFADAAREVDQLEALLRDVGEER